MIKNAIVGLIATLFLFSCDDYKELIIDFDVEVIGEAPNAQLKFINKSKNIDSYTWYFGTGSSISQSNETNPEIIVDRAGEFYVELYGTGSAGTNAERKDIDIPGNSAILTFNDLEFALDKDNPTIGCLYSFEDEKMFKLSEVTDENHLRMGIGFGSMSNTMYFFLSPADSWFGFYGSDTEIVNYELTPTISISEFDKMENDEKLAELTIEGTNDSFGNNDIPGTILFELFFGKKGVIKTKEVNSERILVDIKVQKYDD